ncbi:MAG: hypothetical protein R3C03_22200 [Pirellulaceae bacterium]
MSINQEIGPVEDVLLRRQELRDSLVKLCKHLLERLRDIDKVLEHSAKQDSRRGKHYETLWKVRIRSCEDRIVQFMRRVEVRPSICTMGKRGQGKTTLLHSWLGKSKSRGGLEEILKLPTGDYDTTAALIRLTEAKKHEPKLDPRFLFVDLISKQELSDVTERPGHLAESFIKLQKQVNDEQVEQNAAYRICRFPVERYEDHKLWLDSNGSDGYHVSRDGSEQFSIAQWTAKQVSIPVELASEKQHGYAAKLLRAVDVIDAPGADSHQAGELPMWKARKTLMCSRQRFEKLM